MSHSTSTANYSLPQFAGTDKPAWLGDINPAMSAIDTQMKANADASTTAGTNATTALNSVGTLSSLNTTEKGNLVGAVNEVNTNLGTVSGVASGASTTATQAKNKADGIQTYLTMTNFKELVNGTDITITNGSISSARMRIARNADGTLGKIYGDMALQVTSNANATLTIRNTGFAPSSSIQIYGMFNLFYAKTDNSAEFVGEYIAPATVGTDGTITITLENFLYNRRATVVFPPCLYFFEDFGD